MIDIHSHILPGMDDGSNDRETSILMLNSLKKSGIDEVIATPHFYPYKENPKSFINRRENAIKTLGDISGTGVNVRLGAEVYYYDGIGFMDDEVLYELCAGGTNHILIEMPFSAWTRRMTDSVLSVGRNGRIRLVLAHIERYIGFGENLKLIKQLKSFGVLTQVNTSAFDGFFAKNKMIRLINSGIVDFIASDAHNNGVRKQEFDKAFDCIGSKLGRETLKRIEERTERHFSIKDRV